MRSFTGAIQTLISAFQQPPFAVLISFATLGVKYTNSPSAITYGGSTYTPALIKISGLGENLKAEAPSAVLEIGDLDGTERARFHADTFRGDVLTVRIVTYTSGAWTDTGWSMVVGCDADEANASGVMIRLASSDSVEGTDVPRRTTQEAGCQHDFQRGLCPFRWRSSLSATLKTCDKGYDSPNGCKAHFPDVTDSSGVKHIVPKPFGGFRGGVSHHLVVRSGA